MPCSSEQGADRFPNPFEDHPDPVEDISFRIISLVNLHLVIVIILRDLFCAEDDLHAVRGRVLVGG